MEFVVPRMGRSLFLHKKIIAIPSEYIKRYLVTEPGQRMEWEYVVEREVDKKALIKALRFCYGEDIYVEAKDGECFSLISTFSKLQVTCLQDIVKQIHDFAIKEAERDVLKGVEMLKACVRYEECCNTSTCKLNQDLAKVVLTKDNIMNHYREVVDECLIILPPEYLMMTEFGEPHTVQ